MSQTNWKPVNEPPELRQEWDGPLRSYPVLVYRKSGSICVAYCEVWPGCESAWTITDSEGWCITNEVTHWMPLPDPPKEVSE